MRQRIYIDNSVIGGYFDKEFEVATKQLFDRIIAKDWVIRLLILEHHQNFLNMKTKTKKSFDTVAFFRAIKEKLATKMTGMTLEQKKDFMQQVIEKKIKIAQKQRTKKNAIQQCIMIKNKTS